jgi:hypothetical protein
VLWKIRLPNALPTLFAGMKVGISFALVGAIVGEFVAGSDGLGTVILIAEGQFDTTRVFAALVMLGCSARCCSTRSSSPRRCCCRGILRIGRDTGMRGGDCWPVIGLVAH